jgi:hypothetical protein
MGFKVKQNGSWVDVSSAFVKQNGSWQEVQNVLAKSSGTWTETYSAAPANLLLIDNSYKNPLLGGFLYDDCWNPPGTSGVGTRASTFYNDSSGISIMAPYWGCGTAFSNNNVDLTGGVSVTYSWSWSNVAYYGGGSFSIPLANGTRQSFSMRSTNGPTNGSATDVTVALTGAGGIGNIQFGAGNTSSGRMYLHKLQINYA